MLIIFHALCGVWLTAAVRCFLPSLCRRRTKASRVHRPVITDLFLPIYTGGTGNRQYIDKNTIYLLSKQAATHSIAKHLWYLCSCTSSLRVYSKRLIVLPLRRQAGKQIKELIIGGLEFSETINIGWQKLWQTCNGWDRQWLTLTRDTLYIGWKDIYYRMMFVTVYASSNGWNRRNYTRITIRTIAVL